MGLSAPTKRAGFERSIATGVPSWLLTTAAWVVPVAFWAASLALAFSNHWIFKRLATEDGPIEDTQALVLFGCGLVAAAIAWLVYSRKDLFWSLVYAGLAVVVFWIAGEEISWGQRIFDLGTPELLASNVQNEANLHNLPGVTSTLHSIMLFGLWVAIALSIVTRFSDAAKAARWRTELWVPSPLLIPAWLCFISYSWVRDIDLWWRQADQVQRVVSMAQEPAELILYAGVLTFLVTVWIRLRSESRARFGSPAS